MCKLAPSRAVEPDGVELSGRMASVLMAIPSVLAEAGFATGAGGSGAFAVVGCGVSAFLSPHIFPSLLGQRHLQNYWCKTGVQNTVAPWSKVEQEIYGRRVPYSNTSWVPGWEDHTLQECSL